jgi:hypothetical protein
MVPVTSLWLPILVSAVIVFVASSIVHMVLPFHRGDLKTVPREDEVMTALRAFKIPPGDYAVPHPASMKDMRSPAFLEKRAKGPVLFMTVVPEGPMSMGPSLIQWFLFSVVVNLFAAYVASRALGPGAPYLDVFRFAGTTAFLGYSMGFVPQSIWYRRSWVTTIKSMIDGLLYGLLTAGTLGWLWPR